MQLCFKKRASLLANISLNFFIGAVIGRLFFITVLIKVCFSSFNGNRNRAWGDGYRGGIYWVYLV